MIDRFGPLVWSFARRFTPDRPDAEDAVLDVFVALWKSLARYDPSRVSEQTFVAMVARRRLIDRRRRLGRLPGTTDLRESPDTPGSAPAPLEPSQDIILARRALSALPPDEQRAIRLTIYYGLTPNQIGAKLSLPVSTVQANIRGGLLRVREMLGGGRPAAARRQLA